MATVPEFPRGGAVRAAVRGSSTLLVLFLCPACPGPDAPDPGPGVEQPPAHEDDLVARALPLFREALGGTYPPPTPRVLRARELVGREKRLLLEEEVAENPASGEATMILSEWLMNRGQFGAAREGLVRILEQGPTFPRCEQVFQLYGRCLTRLGEGEEARAALEAHRELRPGDGVTDWALGLLEVQEGHPEEALREFEKSLAAYQAVNAPPQMRARTHVGMADAYVQLEELDKARASLDLAVRQNPADPQAHYALSRVLTRLGETEAAARAMQGFARARAAAGSRPGGR